MVKGVEATPTHQTVEDMPGLPILTVQVSCAFPEHHEGTATVELGSRANASLSGLHVTSVPAAASPITCHT